MVSGSRSLPWSLVLGPFWGYLGVLSQVLFRGRGYPSPVTSATWEGYPRTEVPPFPGQEPECLLHGGPYASSGHAGRLSCFNRL